MRIASLVIGIIGGILLIWICWNRLCWIGFTGGGENGHKTISIALPVLALIGVRLVTSKPVAGAALMALAAGGILWWLGSPRFPDTLGSHELINMMPAILLGLASLLGFFGADELKKPEG